MIYVCFFGTTTYWIQFLPEGDAKKLNYKFKRISLIFRDVRSWSMFKCLFLILQCFEVIMISYHFCFMFRLIFSFPCLSTVLSWTGIHGASCKIWPSRWCLGVHLHSLDQYNDSFRCLLISDQFQSPLLGQVKSYWCLTLFSGQPNTLRRLWREYCSPSSILFSKAHTWWTYSLIFFFRYIILFPFLHYLRADPYERILSINSALNFLDISSFSSSSIVPTTVGVYHTLCL